MKNFLKYTLATITGVIISTFLLSIIMFGILGILISSSDKPVSINSNSILHLKIDRAIPDRTPQNPVDFNFFSFNITHRIGLNDILENLEKAKTDPKITGIFLEFGILTPGIATMEEIRDALEDFKSSGKFIIAFANDVLPQSSYYLSTIADKIYINPVAIFEFFGLRAEIMYYKGALDKLGIEMQIIRHGKFKSAVEPFFRKNMSEESREQIMAYIGSIWNQMLTQISEARNIPVDELNRIADELVIQQPENALNSGLIDGLMYQDEVIDTLRVRSKLEDKKRIRLISMTKYSKVPKKRSGKKGLVRDKIAVIYATGVIGMGEGSESSIGGRRFVKAIRTVRKDTSVKAIVLRVNSPGGSALVSEQIWREVYLAQKEKPVIGSMGNLAASGGYYILAAADTLISHPTTLTGSIGVFGTIPNAEKLFNDKLGLTFDVAKTNEYSDFGSIYRPLRIAEREYLQSSVEKTYETFILHVSEGRNMPAHEVDKIGQGRVWSGINAKEVGLVDLFGGLKTAIDIAAEKANLEHFRIVVYPKLEDPLEKLLRNLTGELRTIYLRKELGNYYKYIEDLKEVINSHKIQMHLPFSYEIY